MKRTLITPDTGLYPSEFHSLLTGADVYDSSCSPEARVIYIDRENGYFLKSAPKCTLEKEAALTRFFHEKGLAADVQAYVSHERDWLLTRRVPGEDLTHTEYLASPERLCDLLAERLRILHETDAEGCPVPDRTADYLATAEKNFKAGMCDTSLFPDGKGYSSADEAWREICKNGCHLQSDVLIHGDYCLPNVICDNLSFSGFIDLGNAGIGDRHIDLFWGAWTLRFNLKTDRYTSRFLDAYGRDTVNTDILRTVAAAEVFG